jgi:DNA-binding transcriptional ArsR family regulator
MVTEANRRPDPEMSAERVHLAGVIGSRDAGRLFEVLADATRRQVVQLLSYGPRSAGEIADSAGVSGPAMSRHLRVLLKAGVVSDERAAHDARVRVFSLQPESMAAIQAWLDQLQAHWSDQLASFKRHVEGSSR